MKEFFRRITLSLLSGALGNETQPLGPYATKGWDHIPKDQYDYLPKGKYVYGPSDKFLLVPKNRYKAMLLPDQATSSDLGVGWITEDNSAAGYDLLWGDQVNLAAFREEADGVREKLTREIVDCLESGISDGAAVVDIGCGVGDLLTEIRKRKPGVAVSGLDFSQKAVEAAATAFPEGSFVQHVIDRTLPYATAQFDVVLCTDVLEHLDRPKAIAAELVRICRPGGLVAIVVPDGDVDQFLGHYWFWNAESLRAMLADWTPEVIRLPETREFLARIAVPGDKESK